MEKSAKAATEEATKVTVEMSAAAVSASWRSQRTSSTVERYMYLITASALRSHADREKPKSVKRPSSANVKRNEREKIGSCKIRGWEKRGAI